MTLLKLFQEESEIKENSRMEEIQMAKKTLEEMLNISGHKINAKIKMKLRFHLTPVQMGIIKNMNNNKYW
jgi:hypothetical protein